MNGLCYKIGSIFLESKSDSFDNKAFVPKDRNSRRWFGTHAKRPVGNII